MSFLCQRFGDSTSEIVDAHDCWSADISKLSDARSGWQINERFVLSLFDLESGR